MSSTSLTFEGAEIYRDKETGLLIKTTEAGTISEREYKFNEIDESMGLFCNPWATDGDDVRDFICLNCATRWNKKNEKIVNDQL